MGKNLSDLFYGNKTDHLVWFGTILYYSGTNRHICVFYAVFRAFRSEVKSRDTSIFTPVWIIRLRIDCWSQAQSYVKNVKLATYLLYFLVLQPHISLLISIFCIKLPYCFYIMLWWGTCLSLHYKRYTVCSNESQTSFKVVRVKASGMYLKSLTLVFSTDQLQ